VAIELNEGYLQGSRFRFDRRNLENLLPFDDEVPETPEKQLITLFD